MSVDLQSVNAAKNYLQEALLTIQKTKMGVFEKTNSLNSANASGTPHAARVGSVNAGDDTMDITAEALCDLSQIFMQIKGSSPDKDQQIADLIAEIKGLLDSVKDPDMKTLIQNGLDCFKGNADPKDAFIAYWQQTPKESNPTYQILMFFENNNFKPETANVDVGYRLSMFYLSCFDSGLAAIGLKDKVNELLGRGNFYTCEDDLWRFILTYAKEKGISTDMIQAILPPAPTPAGTYPNYEKFLNDLKANMGTYPVSGSPDAASIWSGWHLATFLDPSS